MPNVWEGECRKRFTCTESSKMGWDNLLSIVVGWVLGILSSIITDRRQKRSQKKEVKRGILAELKETQIVVVSNCYSLTYRFGTFDRDFLTWILPYYNKFKKIDATNKYDELIRFVDETLKLSDDQIATLINDIRQREQQEMNSKTGLTLKKIETPYLDSKLGFLSLLSESFQRQVLGIRREIGFVNEDIELAWYYFKRTFDAISDTNYQLVDANLQRTYLDLVGKTQRLADKIEQLNIKS
ncbi:MAG: hypothetical protein ACE5H1_06000 [Thermodesulfobacteriota bacterium]